MAQSTVNFLSSNSTGMNTVKTTWIRDLCKMTKIDFFSLQEHFKCTKSVDKYFKEQFPDYIPYVIPAVRAENQDSGRAKGGLCQFSNKKMQLKIERIKTSSFRIQAQIINFPTTRIIWINTYLPNDPLTINFDDRELLDILHEVENKCYTAAFNVYP